ncbi:Hypothetical protein IALB_1228 [Ignavibacterium album JCM 16511]|uniref:DUF2130 domain-containing protein n=1 Tax=Ignavibacterium album (strain DSM 19864 / JCM 16511 / NBRC 101810 / Mat9-16) TaxID=945713 RepID=I0AIY2_IGNAJ|nr:DUF2130 domain-containing protein [Ignavibacterium album]AFH48939.1 Hypothetical protein IALB_1228 [Ignavibacterium album JCM 16511]
MKKLFCPVCGKPLTQEEYDKALGLWKEKQEHIKHLEAEQKKFKEQQKQYEIQIREAQKKILEERKKLKLEAQKLLQKQKEELLDSFRKKMETEIKKGIESGVREQKKQFIKQSAELRKTQNKMKRLKESLRLSASKYEKANEEIKRLKEQIEKGITPQIEGLLEEKTLMNKLQELYPDDKFIHTGKGGDIIQIIFDQKKEVGKIVYECKKVKNFDKKFIEQAKNARKQREADFAILITNAFPSKKQYYFVEKNVFVISPVSLEPITYTLRESLIRIALLKLTNEAKEKAVQQIYNYLSGNEYKNRINEISQHLIDLGNELSKEISTHKNLWLKRYNAYKSIYSDVNLIDYKLKEFLQNKIPDKEMKLIQSPKKEFIQISEFENN